VAKRADVLVARRKLGFAAAGRREHFVVVQSDLLARLDTVIVAPLDEQVPRHDGDPLSVPVPASETGTSVPHVVLVYLLTSASIDRFDATPAGRLSLTSMSNVDDALRTALEL
jgi:mRNA-degrading endonuclease toxin of MazEF toxin-antitoxin module